MEFLLPLGKGLNNEIFYDVYRDILFIMFFLKNLPHKEFRISNYLNIIKIILEFVAHSVQAVLYKTF